MYVPLLSRAGSIGDDSTDLLVSAGGASGGLAALGVVSHESSGAPHLSGKGTQMVPPSDRPPLPAQESSGRTRRLSALDVDGEGGNGGGSAPPGKMRRISRLTP
jgi:hypothetical protein